mmetsp:Transcript_29598/g.87563  ORF Transcript_29598/g.87563 Transcript_29598/m.87563 type:complete len:232 (-) Transcript_29598:593-1288(-)
MRTRASKVDWSGACCRWASWILTTKSAVACRRRERYTGTPAAAAEVEAAPPAKPRPTPASSPRLSGERRSNRHGGSGLLAVISMDEPSAASDDCSLPTTCWSEQAGSSQGAASPKGGRRHEEAVPLEEAGRHEEGAPLGGAGPHSRAVSSDGVDPPEGAKVASVAFAVAPFAAAAQAATGAGVGSGSRASVGCAAAPVSSLAPLCFGRRVTRFDAAHASSGGAASATNSML